MPWRGACEWDTCGTNTIDPCGCMSNSIMLNCALAITCLFISGARRLHIFINLNSISTSLFTAAMSQTRSLLGHPSWTKEYETMLLEVIEKMCQDGSLLHQKVIAGLQGMAGRQCSLLQTGTLFRRNFGASPDVNSVALKSGCNGYGSVVAMTYSLIWYLEKVSRTTKRRTLSLQLRKRGSGTHRWVYSQTFGSSYNNKVISVTFHTNDNDRLYGWLYLNVRVVKIVDDMHECSEGRVSSIMARYRG